MTLQPTIESPLAQWALNDTTGSLYLDRSGNVKDLSGSPTTDTRCPDLIPGSKGILQSSISVTITRTDAALRLTGALTLTARIWVYEDSPSSPMYIAGCGGSGETSANNLLYQLITSGATRLLGYQAEHSGGTEISFTSSALAVPHGKWAFVGLRRNSAGTVVTLTLGDEDANVHETSGTLTAPTDGSTSVFRLGQRADVGATVLRGAFADVCIWNTSLSDDDMETLRAAAMAELAA